MNLPRNVLSHKSNTSTEVGFYLRSSVSSRRRDTPSRDGRHSPGGNGGATVRASYGRLARDIETTMRKFLLLALLLESTVLAAQLVALELRGHRAWQSGSLKVLATIWIGIAISYIAVLISGRRKAKKQNPS